MIDRAETGDELLVNLSALRHYRFCPRRCALQYVEETWAENAYTEQGDDLHQRVDEAGVEEREGVRVERALPLFCDRLGLTGRGDIVEFHRGADGRETPYPVEYKRGPRRKHDQAEIQLCAQALCLEEMFGVPAPAGAIYFGDSHRRQEIACDAALRAEVEQTVLAVRTLLRSGRTPAARLGPWCDGCSLRPACMPEVTGAHDGSTAYLAALARTVTEAER